MIPATLLLIALAQPAKQADVLQGIRDSSVRVEVRVKVGVHVFPNGEVHDKFQYAVSSGTVVQSSKDGFVVLTCAHGLYHAGKLVMTPKVLDLHDRGKAAKVLLSDPGRDVAVLQVDWKSHPFKVARLADKAAYAKGLSAVRCGYPRNKARTLVDCSLTGEMTSINRDHDSHEAAELYPYAIQGDSGGGLFRSSDGLLIGMTVSTSYDNTTSRAVTLKPIRHVLDKAGVKQ